MIMQIIENGDANEGTEKIHRILYNRRDRIRNDRDTVARIYTLVDASGGRDMLCSVFNNIGEDEKSAATDKSGDMRGNGHGGGADIRFDIQHGS